MKPVYFQAASAAHQKKEKAKARDLRLSAWWKQQLGQGRCYYCEQRFKPSELTMDHVLPIARGGTSDKKNCVTSCKECNTKKGHKLPVEMVLEKMGVEKQDSDKEETSEDDKD